MGDAAGIGDAGGNPERGAGIGDGEVTAAADIGGLLWALRALPKPLFAPGLCRYGLRTAVCSKGGG